MTIAIGTAGFLTLTHSLRSNELLQSNMVRIKAVFARKVGIRMPSAVRNSEVPISIAHDEGLRPSNPASTIARGTIGFLALMHHCEAMNYCKAIWFGSGSDRVRIGFGSGSDRVRTKAVFARKVGIYMPSALYAFRRRLETTPTAPRPRGRPP